MNKNLNDYKDRAKKLRSAVSSVLNVECTQSQAYELIAKEENFPNWDSLSGTINKNPEKKEGSVLTNKEQIFQLFLLYEGLRNGIAFFDVLSILKNQKDPIIKNGWSKIQVSSSINFSDAFAETNFFSQEVLSIIDMCTRTNYLENGVQTAINFLKME
jgi:hypothetical protein